MRYDRGDEAARCSWRYGRVSALPWLVQHDLNLRVFFFFSSRRRHTRSDRDWSSDVCSSDRHDQISYAVFCLRRSEEHTSELQSRSDLVCRLLLEKKKHTSRLSSLADIAERHHPHNNV